MGVRLSEMIKVHGDGNVLALLARKRYLSAATEAMSTKTEAAGLFCVKLTDNPAAYKGLFVDIKSVQAYSSLRGWIELEQKANRVDVLQLTNGREIILAQHRPKMSANDIITKIKIKFGDNNVLVMDDLERIVDERRLPKKPVRLSMFENNECVIDIKNVGKVKNKNEILLDFDVARSVKTADEHYYLDPQISHLSDPYTGISGTLPEPLMAIVYATNFDDIYSSYTDAHGNFLIRGIKDGIYTVMVRTLRSRRMPTQKSKLWCREVEVNKGQISFLHADRWK